MTMLEILTISKKSGYDIDWILENLCPCEFGYCDGVEGCEGDDADRERCFVCWGKAKKEGPEQENKQKQNDTVEHPNHYNREGAIECFDEFIEVFGLEAAMHACLFNIWKYRYRAADKNGIEDLKKSDWYARKLRELHERL